MWQNKRTAMDQDVNGLGTQFHSAMMAGRLSLNTSMIRACLSIQQIGFTHIPAVHIAAAWISLFLSAEPCPDIRNNEHNSKVNAYNGMKTAEHVAL